MIMNRALQERLLARRVLHYNTRQMYFECGEGIIAEDGSRLRKRFRDLNATQDVRTRTESPQGDHAENLASIQQWSSIVKAYGSRNLSRSTDMLPARTWIPSWFCFLSLSCLRCRRFN